MPIEIVLYIATSLDGFIATPEGGIDWLSAIETPEEDYGYEAFYTSVDAIVMGRRTYDQVLSWGDWPYPGKPSYIMTHQPLSSDLAEVSATAQSPSDLMATWSALGYRRVWLVGGAALAAAFRAEGLISEYILSIIPVLLGNGIPLFMPPGPRAEVQLYQAETFTSGVVQLTYRAAKPL
ncbi:dihydrofolate reductase [Nodosilinea sp. LEGE 07298]|nr:dihydrofolate reductase [Nodosilinea sp. LEGE 07298]